MSEHFWVIEQLETYLAGGLDDEECRRLEQHVGECPTCSEALTEARQLEGQLVAVLRVGAPRPGFEDRAVAAFRTRNLAHRFDLRLMTRLTGAAAAVVLLGTVGAVVSGGSGIELRFPGEATRPIAETTAKEPELMAGESTIDESRSYAGSVDQLATELRTKYTQFFKKERLPQLGNTTTWEDSEGASLRTWSINGVLPSPPNVLAVQPGTGPANQNSDLNGPQTPPIETGYQLEMKKLADDSPRMQVDDSRARLGIISPDGKSIISGDGIAVHSSKALDDFQSGKRQSGLGVSPAALYSDYFSPYGNSPHTSTTASPVLNYGFTQSGQAGSGPQSGSEGKFAPPSTPAADSGVRDPEGQQPGRDGEKAPVEEPQVVRRVIIRSGDIEFEVPSFDAAVATISKLVEGIKGGFVATINSDKLPNGKVKGSVVVRVPPESLDGLVLGLRKELTKDGELKRQKIGSQDITKQYTDLESRLRAARAMEQRLLEIIRTGKGEIKDLLAAEKELGVWRTKIEETEGELRYYGNLVALSTLTVTVVEKEIRAPAELLESERVQMGLEVEDVDKTYREALKAVQEAKGRVTRSEVKQQSAGQFSAVLNFEVAPESAGPLRDRLKQLGVVARLEIDRVQQQSGNTPPLPDAKVKRGDTQFFLSLYNLTNVAPRDTVHLNLACADVEETYRTILALVRKGEGRILTSNLNRQQTGPASGTLQFELKTPEAEGALLEMKAKGEVLLLQVTENAASQNTTASKRGFQLQLVSLDAVPARETVTLTVAARDVAAGYQTLQEAVAKAGGRVLNANLNEQDRQNINAQVDVEVPRTEEGALNAALLTVGDVQSRSITRAPNNGQVSDSKMRLSMTLVNLANVAPRESRVYGVEVNNVDQSAAVLSSTVGELQGRTIDSQFTRESDGRVTARLTFDVPVSALPALEKALGDAGTIRVQQASRNPQVPDTERARGRVNVTLSNVQLIVPSDAGLWDRVRDGLSISARALLWSVSWLIVGVCFVLPWGLVGYGGYRLLRWMGSRRPAQAPTTGGAA